MTAKDPVGTGSSAHFERDLAGSGQSDLWGEGFGESSCVPGRTAEASAWPESSRASEGCRNSVVSAKGFVCPALAGGFHAVSTLQHVARRF